AATTATVTASFGGDTWTATLRISHTALAGVAIDPGHVTLTLDGPAPAGGALVTVTSDHPELIQLAGDGPAGSSGAVTLRIPSGSQQAIVPCWLTSPPVTTRAHISAASGRA